MSYHFSIPLLFSLLLTPLLPIHATQEEKYYSLQNIQLTIRSQCTPLDLKYWRSSGAPETPLCLEVNNAYVHEELASNDIARLIIRSSWTDDYSDYRQVKGIHLVDNTIPYRIAFTTTMNYATQDTTGNLNGHTYMHSNIRYTPFKNIKNTPPPTNVSLSTIEAEPQYNLFTQTKENDTVVIQRRDYAPEGTQRVGNLELSKYQPYSKQATMYLKSSIDITTIPLMLLGTEYLVGSQFYAFAKANFP